MSPKIIIGIPSYNEEDSVAFVIKQIDEGIQKFYNPKECLIINLDSDSEDKTREIFLGIPTKTSKKYINTGGQDNYPFIIENGWEAPPVPVSIISGKVTDGYTHNLSDIEVKLLYKHPLFGWVIFATTKTNKDGEYVFSDDISWGTYQVIVNLRSHLETSGPFIFEVFHNTGSIVYVKTIQFTILEGERKEVGVDFADSSLITDPTIPQERLPDMAAIYFHVKQVVDFTKDVLDVSLDLDLPIEVYTFSTLTNTAFYDPVNHKIYIGEKISAYKDKNRPMNREWHESFHEVMDDTIGIPPAALSEDYDTHTGYNNPSTMGSWIEGWAEFWPTALKKTLREPNPHIYIWWGKHTSFEKNWKVWDTLGFWLWKQSKEEFAVASLLWDTIDPINSADDDFINLSIEEMWSIIGSEPLLDMRDVYELFVSRDIGNSDSDDDGISDLDELFIAHGFFADINENEKYDADEKVGWGGRLGRRNTPDIPGTYLLVTAIDGNGNPLSSGTFMVDVFFDPPNDIYNYSYEEELETGNNLFGFAVAPAEEEAIIEIRVKDSQGNLSDTFIMTNPIYWESVEKSTLGYLAGHTFQIGATSRTTILANIDFQPEVLNLKSRGQWITGYIELPIEYNVTEIDISTVLINEINSEILTTSLRAVSSQEYGFVRDPELYDIDNDGILELMVKFDRKELLTLLNSGQYSLIITGKLKSGVELKGVDSIKVIP